MSAVRQSPQPHLLDQHQEHKTMALDFLAEVNLPSISRDTPQVMDQLLREGSGSGNENLARILGIVTSLFLSFLSVALLPVEVSAVFAFAFLSLALILLIGPSRIMRCVRAIDLSAYVRSGHSSGRHVVRLLPVVPTVNLERDFPRPANRGSAPSGSGAEVSATPPVTAQGNGAVGARSVGVNKTPAATWWGNAAVGGRAVGTNTTPSVTSRGNAAVGGRAVGVNDTPAVTAQGNGAVGSRGVGVNTTPAVTPEGNIAVGGRRRD